MSASTVRPLADTSAKPPSTTILRLAAAGIDRDDARPQRRHHRRMAGQHAEIALGARNVDLVDIAGEDELSPARRVRSGSVAIIYCLCSRFTPLPPRASCPSRPPPRWCRPCRRPPPAGGRTRRRTRPLKPLIVSSSSTSLPGEPVNTSATKNGCDRKRSILRARATVDLVLFRQFVHAENGDDVLQRLVALQDLLHLARDLRSAPRRRPAGRACARSSRADRPPDRCPFPRSRATARSSRRDARTRSPAPGRSSRRPARRSPAPR